MSRICVTARKCAKLGVVTVLADRYAPRNCASCGDLLPVRLDGPLGTYCSARCRKRAERARKAARAGLPSGHPSLRAVRPKPSAPARQDQRGRPNAPALVPQGPQRPSGPHGSSERRPEPPRPAPALPRAAAAVPCLACGRTGRLYRLRGYTAAGRLEAETAPLCSHHRGLIWAAWQGQYRMPAITSA